MQERNAQKFVQMITSEKKSRNRVTDKNQAAE